MLLRPSKVKDLFLTDPTAQFDQKSIYLLLHSYCIADRLNVAEYFLYECLSKHVKSCPQDTAAPTLLHQLFPNHDLELAVFSDSDSQSAEECRNFQDVQFQLLNSDSENKVPLYIWATFVRMYSGRQAWRQCLNILDYVESSQLYRSADSESCDSSVDSNAKSSDLVHDVSRFVQSDSPAVQRSVIYHHTIRALSQANQFGSVLDVLARMRSEGVRPELSAVVHLLSIFSATTSSSPTFAVSASNYPQLGELALSLKEDVVLSIVTLSKSFARADSSGDTFSGLQSAIELSATYISLLCRLSHVETAFQFVLFLSEQYPALICEKTVTPVIVRYGEVGVWEGAAEASDILRRHVSANGSKGNSAASAVAYQSLATALRQSRQTKMMANVLNNDALSKSQKSPPRLLVLICRVNNSK